MKDFRTEITKFMFFYSTFQPNCCTNCFLDFICLKLLQVDTVQCISLLQLLNMIITLNLTAAKTCICTLGNSIRYQHTLLSHYLFIICCCCLFNVGFCFLCCLTLNILRYMCWFSFKSSQWKAKSHLGLTAEMLRITWHQLITGNSNTSKCRSMCVGQQN